MDVDVLGDGDVAPVVDAIARWQGDPATNVCIVGTAPDEIADELREVASWRQRTVVATRDGEVVAAVLADVDEDMGRVWWYGPWGVDHEVCRRVLAAASARLPAGIDEEEFGPDERNRLVADLAAERGATAGTPSSVLVNDPLVAPPARVVAGVTLRELDDAHAGEVAALHDLLFPGTHTRGDSLVVADGTEVLVALEDGRVVGYVATEVHADGSLYVDYLGTGPTARRRGIASALIIEALRRGAAAGRPRSHLTVRHDAEGARALYLSLGYVEQQVIVPWRIGFDLG